MDLTGLQPWFDGLDLRIPTYQEPLLKLLGVVDLTVIDYSSFEGANYIHDLNYPVSANLSGRFDLVIDGGTLEHIFNLPMA